MFYPFPLDDLTLYQHTIYYSGGHFYKGDSEIYFDIKFNPKEEKSIFVYYRQTIKGKRVRYIVTTTAHWKRPIKEANFIVLIPSHFKNIPISFTPDSIKRKDLLLYSSAKLLSFKRYLY